MRAERFSNKWLRPAVVALCLFLADRPDGRASAQVEIPRTSLGMTTTAEVGARWREVGGRADMYRSHVNLGNGLKWLSSSTEIRSPKNTGLLFDRLQLNLSNWGGEPYNSLTLRLQKHQAYDFEYRYSKIDYFHFVPGFSNPLLSHGVLLGQHSYDITRRRSDFTLRLMPHSPRFKFRVGYTRNSSFGPSLTTFNAGGDEFVLRRLVKNSTDDYRVGVEARFRYFDFAFEQSVRRFRDDQGLIQPKGVNLGNDPNPAFVDEFPTPEQLLLTALSRSYHVRGWAPTTRLAVNFKPTERFRAEARLFYGDFNLDYKRSQALTGRVFNLNEFFSYVDSILSLNAASPSKPFTVADLNLSYCPMARLTLKDTFRFSHFDIAGGTIVTSDLKLDGDPFGNPPPDQPLVKLVNVFNRRVFLNSFLNQFEGVYNITNRLMARVGHRYTFRRANRLIKTDDELLVDETKQITNTLLAGAGYRLTHRLRLYLDYENGGHDNVFTAVRPLDFQRVRLRGQVQPNDTLTFTGSLLLYDTTRPNRFVENQARSRSFSLSASVAPSGRFSFDVDYSRSDLSSAFAILIPDRAPLPQSFREDSDIVHSSFDVALVKEARLRFGYNLVNTSGSFPLNFHRPFAALSIPVRERVSLKVGYEYYGYNERGRSVQDYRANLVTTSLKFSF